MITIPNTAEAFRDATWADILPYYEELAARPLSPPTAGAWLEDWSRLESLIYEARARANFAYSCNTADPEREEAKLRFGTEIAPKAQEQRTRLVERLVESGYNRPDLESVIKRFRNEVELFNPVNVPLLAQIAEHVTAWEKINGAMTVTWEGEEKTPAQLLPFLESTDRSVRERAFRLRAKPYIDQRQVLGERYDRLRELRQKVARNAGFDNFRDFAHREKNRFDYTPDDCLRFHQAVEEAVVPAVKRIHERRRKRMGLDRLRPWDLSTDPEGREPLEPFEDIATFVSRTSGLFAHVDPDFRGYFDRMAEQRLLDLDNRKGKAPGGYCDDLQFSKMPLIFMNAVGIDEDVRTLLHESGHAFHAFEAFKLPLIFQREYGSEIAEVASMSMELLASPFLDRDKGGYYSESDARRSREELLEGIVLFFPHCASVDAFQQWAYTDPAGADINARDRKWLELRQRFEGDSVDWTGLEAERIARWYQQPHFFSYPFYYIEYGLAQLGALQVWRNSLRDGPQAVRRYREALALGATRPLPELYKAAGARLIFDSDGMRELITLVEEQLERLA
ncbi:MAG TPA: M3 family oligoendopeptidase [Candidatus Udaeobacter sp.]|nr:M3 family oligoendopeptidase [Candidatus Udaeobacter sp.]